MYLVSPVAVTVRYALPDAVCMYQENEGFWSLYFMWLNYIESFIYRRQLANMYQSIVFIKIHPL